MKPENKAYLIGLVFLGVVAFCVILSITNNPPIVNGWGASNPEPIITLRLNEQHKSKYSTTTGYVNQILIITYTGMIDGVHGTLGIQIGTFKQGAGFTLYFQKNDILFLDKHLYCVTEFDSSNVTFELVEGS